MTRQIIFAAVGALALGGCSGRANQQGTTAKTETADSPVTIVGCLVPGGSGNPSAAVGTSGNTASGGFTLIDTMATSTAATDTGAGSGATGTSGSAAVDTGTPRSYDLVVNDKDKTDELQKYVNSRVEVRGYAVAATDTGAGVPDVGAASAPAGTPPTAVQRVRVDRVRQIDASCTPAKR
jgi:hypothetical protein